MNCRDGCSVQRFSLQHTAALLSLGDCPTHLLAVWLYDKEAMSLPGNTPAFSFNQNDLIHYKKKPRQAGVKLIHGENSNVVKRESLSKLRGNMGGCFLLHCWMKGIAERGWDRLHPSSSILRAHPWKVPLFRSQPCPQRVGRDGNPSTLSGLVPFSPLSWWGGAHHASDFVFELKTWWSLSCPWVGEIPHI